MSDIQKEVEHNCYCLHQVEFFGSEAAAVCGNFLRACLHKMDRVAERRLEPWSWVNFRKLAESLKISWNKIYRFIPRLTNFNLIHNADI